MTFALRILGCGGGFSDALSALPPPVRPRASLDWEPPDSGGDEVVFVRVERGKGERVRVRRAADSVEGRKLRNCRRILGRGFLIVGGSGER